MYTISERIQAVNPDDITVLIVDDVLPIVEEMLTLLQLTKIPATAATSLAEALMALEECPNITVVVCDVRLGKDSGLDLMRRVRADPQLAARELDCVFVTGDPMGIDRFPDGAAPLILTKPVMPREFIALVRELLQARQGQLG